MSEIHVAKKKGESFESLFRRFTRRVQSSGKMLTARQKRYFQRKPNKNRIQDSAIRRIEKGAEFEYKLRSGKITEEELRATRRR